MAGKLDPTNPGAWQDYYRDADKRRRQAGWHRRAENKPMKRRLDASRVLAVVMGVAALAVILCLCLPV